MQLIPGVSVVAVAAGSSKVRLLIFQNSINKVLGYEYFGRCRLVFQLKSAAE